MDKRDERIAELEKKIADLPRGTITYKNIRGKEQPYLQWTENGKTKSKYIKVSERENVVAEVEERYRLQDELKELKAEAAKSDSGSRDPEGAAGPSMNEDPVYETNVMIGSELNAFKESVAGWEKRDCFGRLMKYINGSGYDRVCLLYGLRRTGKTTLLRQALCEMTGEQFGRAVYIKARATDNMGAMNRDMKKLFNAGYKYVFIDEVTLMEDFIDSAALFSDIYAAMGMKIVLSGTDSLGFWFTLRQELYDRAVTIHTTFIPFREHSRLLGISDIDEYIRYGGTLRAGELLFDDDDVNADDASFRDDETTRRYIDTAICRNIQHSLDCCRDGNYYRHLRYLYDAGELTNAINRVIEDMTHRFVLRTFTKKFVSHDLGSSAQLLRKERDPKRQSDVLDRINTADVTNSLMKLLDIRNSENLSIGITKTHISEIKEYLKALDLITDNPVETAEVDSEPLEGVLFSQPGMRYCQAQALVFSLKKDEVFSALGEPEKNMVCERILEEVRGRMTEEIVLLETAKALPRSKRVFKMVFAGGEYDMVIYDNKTNTCECYEIKHSDSIVPEQSRYLTDETCVKEAERRFGTITKKCVIYRGDDAVTEDRIVYTNVEKYLKELGNEAI